MPKTRVLIADNLGDDEAVQTMIEALKPNANVAYRPAMNREELLSGIPHCEVLVVRSRTNVDRELIERARSLRLVITATHGSDHIDIERLNSRGIEFKNVSEQTNAVAELVIALLLCLARKIPLADRLSKDGLWRKDELVGVEIFGKTLGIVGFGRIGQLVAEKASALGMRALVYEADVTPEKGDKARKIDAKIVPLDELLRRSDFITMHVPKTKTTSKMIREEQFSSMKDGVFFINAARGDIVDEGALLKFLDKGKFGGVAIDVYSVQPPFSRPQLEKLLSDDRVIATQHIGGQTKEARRATVRAISDTMEEFLIGR